jgi:glucosamine-6-phosphate deaminase
MNIFFTAAIVLFTCFTPLRAVSIPAVFVYDDSLAVGEAAAQKIADTITTKQKESNAPIVIGLATGNTPIPTYAAFKKLVRANNLDLSNVITFNLDEYVGLPTSHPQSYHSFMFTYLFDDLVASSEYPQGIKRENIHIPKGACSSKEDLSCQEVTALTQQFPDSLERQALTQDEQYWIAEQRAIAYEALIEQLGPIDLQILGIGRNGHIGFAEPGTPFDSTTMVAKLTENTRNTNASFFDGNVEEVPEFAITMGIKTILRSKEILLLATGSSKAAIIYEVLTSPISTNIPCSSLWLHEKTSFILDKEADRLLLDASTVMANS